MTAADPFRELGLLPGASADEVRRARRELAKNAHPDVGGDANQMRSINDAAASALKLIADAVPVPPEPRTAEAGVRSGSDWEPTRRDMPSFTVEALPVDTFEALLLAAAALGEVEDDDPPYGLDVLMSAPLGCWCHLSVVPDAGASTVSIAVAPEPESVLPPIERVRDAWITELNSLDWSTLH